MEQRTRRPHVPRAPRRRRRVIFLFENDDDHTFWMKNTPLPLDMIFITKSLTVAGAVENTRCRLDGDPELRPAVALRAQGERRLRRAQRHRAGHARGARRRAVHTAPAGRSRPRRPSSALGAAGGLGLGRLGLGPWSTRAKRERGPRGRRSSPSSLVAVLLVTEMASGISLSSRHLFARLAPPAHLHARLDLGLHQAGLVGDQADLSRRFRT